MNKKLLLTIATAIGITAAATTVVAAPLPAGTKLTFIKSPDGAFVGPLPGCANGSCFGTYLFSGQYGWFPLGPGTDGGLIIGKGQRSGGQEIDGLSHFSGELTENFVLGGNWATFFTAPSDAGNVFDDASCTGSGCGSNTTPIKTALKVWHLAWAGQIIPMGSAAGCNKTLLPACTTDQVAGIFVKTWDIDPAGTVPRKYRLTYNQVVPQGFTNYPFELILRGEVGSGANSPIVIVTPTKLTGVYGAPIPFTISVVDPDGPAVPICRVGTTPANGIVVLNGCSSGTYTANSGFVGTDSFTIIANDSLADGWPVLVNAAISAPPPPTPTPLPPPADATPLPAGTLLTIEKTTDAPFVGPLPGCTNGSCFGLYLFSGLYAWPPLGPGTDGGIIIGKGQKSGGQELDSSSANNGELTEIWDYGNKHGTFFTAPSDAGNVFDNASCTGAGCIGKTELKVWNAAWYGENIPMGSAAGCNKTLLSACTADQVAGIFVKTWDIDPAGTVPRKYRLTYNQVMPQVYTNYPFELVLTGEVVARNSPPVVTVTPPSFTGVYGAPIPFTISVVDPDGPAVPICRVGTTPANGIVVLNGCSSGTYTANSGFVGTDSFTVIANDGTTDSAPALVNVAVTAPSASPTPTPTTSVTPTPTPTIIVDGCPIIYPVTQTTITGKQGHLSITVTGNIVSVNPNGKEIKICPITNASYTTSTNTPGATVVCKVKSNTAKGKGHMKVNDHIKCTDKPVGNDKLGIKIKSGVNQKAM